MAIKKTRTQSVVVRPTRASLAKMVKERSDALHAAIEDQISEIPGIKLHSVLFSVDASTMSDPCGGRCNPGQVCLLSSGGVWKCV
jgi:hypothetical protein